MYEFIPPKQVGGARLAEDPDDRLFKIRPVLNHVQCTLFDFVSCQLLVYTVNVISA